MQKGCVAPYALTAQTRPGKAPRRRRRRWSRTAYAPEARPSRHAALQAVVAHTPVDSTVVLAATGFCGRELYAIADRPNQLYMVGLDGLRRAPRAGSRPRTSGPDRGRARWRRRRADAARGVRDARRLRAAESAPSAARQRRARFDRRTGDRLAVRVVRGDCRRMRLRDAHSRPTTRRASPTWLQAPPPRVRASPACSSAPERAQGLPRPSMSPVEVKQRLLQHLRSQR